MPEASNNFGTNPVSSATHSQNKSNNTDTNSQHPPSSLCAQLSALTATCFTHEDTAATCLGHPTSKQQHRALNPEPGHLKSTPPAATHRPFLSILGPEQGPFSPSTSLGGHAGSRVGTGGNAFPWPICLYVPAAAPPQVAVREDRRGRSGQARCTALRGLPAIPWHTSVPIRRAGNPPTGRDTLSPWGSRPEVATTAVHGRSEMPCKCRSLGLVQRGGRDTAQKKGV